MQRSYRGRNIIYCAVSFGERERESIPPVLTLFFLPLFIQSWLTEHSCSFFCIPCFMLIQSAAFVAGSCSGYKQSYTVRYQADLVCLLYRSCWRSGHFLTFLAFSLVMNQCDTLDQDWYWSWLNRSGVGQMWSVHADLLKTYKDTLHNWWFTPTYTNILAFTVRKSTYWRAE